jgi:L-ascorbate metabolism protein UlaG (beta-lactamase superfamily)
MAPLAITHTHTDHLDPRAIAALRTPETRLIVPTSAKDMLLDISGAQTMANGERLDLGDLVVEAVPMYNMEPDPQLGSIFHPKGHGNGYIISVGGTRVYPYHHFQADPAAFESALKGSGIEVRLRDWYVPAKRSTK